MKEKTMILQSNQNSGRKTGRTVIGWSPAARVLAVAAVLLCTTVVHAAPLGVGATLYPAPAGAGPEGGQLQAGTGVTVPFASANFNGTLTSSVIAGDSTNPYGPGALTFTYLLNSDVASVNQIERLTINGWTGFLSDAIYQTPATGLAPGSIDRNAADVIGFWFLPVPVGSGTLSPGQASALLVVYSDATAYTSSFASVIDGTVVSLPTLSPAPEPATLMLTLIGGALLSIRRAKR
jgi:hypothetical protein